MSRLWLAVLAFLTLSSDCSASQAQAPIVAAFYYLWYRSEPIDGYWKHHNHRILPHWDPKTAAKYPSGDEYQVPDESHAPYRPARGLYSSKDPSIIDEHMRDMRDHDINVAVVSWWGRPGLAASVDGEGVSTDEVVAGVLEVAAKYGVQVAFHLEPYVGRNVSMIREDLAYIQEQYGAHEALYRRDGKLVCFVYDAYHIEGKEWAKLLAPDGELSVRGSAEDAFMIALMLSHRDKQLVLDGHFDGSYTYFAAEGFSYGSTLRNWQQLHTWSLENGKLFVPSVGPGYDDSKIRPWNARNTRERQNGAYYARMWKAALALEPPVQMVSITSYNEWGEGTQIEAVTPYTSPKGVVYKEYPSENYYLQKTKVFASELTRKHADTQHDEL